jgi:hypothetical protein
MASTSTNKQPLLVDRPLHEIVDLIGATVEPNSTVDIGGSNGAELLVDCTTSDGAILSEIYAIAREDTSVTTPYIVNMYISNANDFLRPSQAYFVGTFLAGVDSASAPLEGYRSFYGDMPYILGPIPAVGSTESVDVVGTQFRAMYIPKGKALWVAVKKQSTGDTAAHAPLVGAIGGYY